MRNIFLIFLLLVLGVGTSFAQEKQPRNLPVFDYKRLHWGFTVGLNSMDYAIVRNTAANGYLVPDVYGFQPAGFQVNIVSDLRLSDNLTLRLLPGINLGSRNFVYFNPADLPAKDTTMPVKRISVNSSFLDFPLLLKYRSERVNNYRPYIIGGISFKYDMSAKKNFSYDPDEQIRFLVKKANLYLEAGFGIDYYSQYFKFSPEIKLAIGLRNMMVNGIVYNNQEYYSNSISDLRSFLVMVNFHFE